MNSRPWRAAWPSAAPRAELETAGVLPAGPRLLTLFEDALQHGEVFPIRPTHRECHKGRHPCRKTTRLTAIRQRHTTASSFCRPRVGRFHRERAVRRSHHESLIADPFSDLVRICE